MKINRILKNEVKNKAKKIGVISIFGPRQSGKTTLVKDTFPNYKYFNLEDLSLKAKIEQDPKGFIDRQETGIILDEVQKYPELLSYIQINIDEKFKVGKFIITGSQNLVLSEKVSQSLAGRVSIFKLLPFSIRELSRSSILKSDHLHQILYGFYPRIYSQNLAPHDFYPDYLETYIERDVRQIKNIGDLTNFQRFLKLLAGRIGQLLNLSTLASDVGVSYKTISSWISLLESTYIVFRLSPFYKNFGKRIVKSPKIYFYDTGILCYLLGIDKVSELETHPLIGNIFENMIVADIKKQIFNQRLSSEIYFFRDNHNNEIDLIIKNGSKLYPLEIKLGSSFNNDYLKGINFWNSLQKNDSKGYVVYTGDDDMIKNTKFLNWKSVIKLTSILK